jgi:hypothetical protein
VYPSGGGFDVTNPADGAKYQVRPNMLTIISNGHVDSAEPGTARTSGRGHHGVLARQCAGRECRRATEWGAALAIRAAVGAV